MTERKNPFEEFLPQVKFNKNGYEIRTQVLELANEMTWQNYSAKVGEFEGSSEVKDGEHVAKVTFPAAPTADDVLETAKKFYEFVNKDN